MYITTENGRCDPAPIIAGKDIEMEIVCASIGLSYPGIYATLAVFGG
jgi:hypothetical protein